MLGQNVDVRVSENPADPPIEKPSTSYIWPVCLPKDDDDEHFSLPLQEVVRPASTSPTSTGHPNQQQDTVNAMFAGWLDAPPISQAFSNLLGSSLTEADVLK